ncbi:TIR domain-containing protein [Nonlabens marinus]|uniref:Uncharacterized protein n=1 Tax=Nonlabens marinus S1-08 TaxID=1454201 RepID=W8VP98_9FLAO|nr:hypothetical protein [Nonlabens marinus]BAO54919.1 hypothetical protein NMS_0910 [Nonlabens marinus S1-08]
MNPSTKPKKFCFVLMPFTDDFDDIYKFGIKESCAEVGAYCERVDEQLFTESILERVYNQISKADFIIADMTNRNPNVFYEVGYAHALGKRTILLTQNVEDIPFDLKHYPHIIYQNKISKLKEDLIPRLKWFVENSEKEDLSQNVDIEIFIGEKSLANKGTVVTFNEKSIPKLEFTIYNKSFKLFNPGDYRLGIITDQNYKRLRTHNPSLSGIKTTRLPDGRNLHMCRIMDDILYPNSYTSLVAYLEPKTISENTDNESVRTFRYREEQEIIVRVFTPTGTRDFFLNVSPLHDDQKLN